MANMQYLLADLGGRTGCPNLKLCFASEGKVVRLWKKQGETEMGGSEGLGVTLSLTRESVCTLTYDQIINFFLPKMGVVCSLEQLPQLSSPIIMSYSTRGST